jgi:hypothetical protein
MYVPVYFILVEYGTNTVTVYEISLAQFNRIYLVNVKKMWSNFISNSVGGLSSVRQVDL